MTVIMSNSTVFLVSDFDRSVAFYDAVMAELSFPRCNNFENNGIRESQYCFDQNSVILSIHESPGYSSKMALTTIHISFPAKNQIAVDKFFATAIANGATEIQKPGLREDNSYTASVKDLDDRQITVVWRNSN
ncbi:MAG: hypothetical protein ACK4V0_08010 [Aphanizomenon sp.]|jgi:predicted lactoylglutathione lyase